MKKILWVCNLLFGAFSLFAQDGFKYQAVVRDNAGAIVPNQAVGFQMSILQPTINGSPVYTETHTATSNAFGLVNLVIGEGTATLGTFEEVNWKLNSFLKVEMDVTGGTSYVTMGTSAIMPVPKALYAVEAGNLSSRYGLYVTDFGAVGDGNTDDSQAFQDALDSAATHGNKVFVPAANYRLNTSISIPKGVTLIGEGIGNNPLQTPSNGSSIHFYGSTEAILITGHDAGLRDLIVVDKGQNATTGVLIQADGVVIESLRFFNVLISGFIAGTGLQLEAANDGGIFYGSFYNLRIRNAKIGLRILEIGTNAYVNSNTFHHGAISGGGFDYCLWVGGGNNNKFYGTVIEPYTSNFGHVVVDSGEIQTHDIRIEAINQPASTPVVELKEASQHCYFHGFFAGGHVVDKGNNQILFRSGKGVQFAHSDENRFENATFSGFNGKDVPYWDISGVGVTMEVLDPEITEEHHVLKLTVPAGVLCEIRQDFAYMPATNNILGLYEELTFGFHVKTDIPNVVYLTTIAPAGVTTSSIYNGDNTWQFIGSMNLTDLSQTLVPKLNINNTTASPIVVYLSNPTLNFGGKIPKIEPKPITSAGGIVTGTLSTGFFEVDAVPANGFLILPKYGNVFMMNGTQTILRINDLTNDRFPKGTVITLLFNDANQTVWNSVYLSLKNGMHYVSSAGSSLTLIHVGDGLWKELSRNL